MIQNYLKDFYISIDNCLEKKYRHHQLQRQIKGFKQERQIALLVVYKKGTLKKPVSTARAQQLRETRLLLIRGF